jgi:hypothetical protein
VRPASVAEPPVACPHCAHGFGRPATATPYVVYYRCTMCWGIWSVARPGVPQILGPDTNPHQQPDIHADASRADRIPTDLPIRMMRAGAK